MIVNLSKNIIKLTENLSATDFVDRTNFNIKKEYDYLNRVVFDNDLPKDLKFNWFKSKVKNGEAVKELRSDKKYHSSEIRLSDFFKITYEQMQGILVHEMVHIYFNTIGNTDKNPHGAYFFNKVKEINNSHKLPFLVPGTSTIDFVPQTKQSKLQLVRITLRNKKPQGILVLNPKLEEEVIMYSKTLPEDWFKAGYEIEIYRSSCPGLQLYPIHSKYPKEWKSFKIVPETLYDDIKKESKPLITITKHEDIKIKYYDPSNQKEKEGYHIDKGIPSKGLLAYIKPSNPKEEKLYAIITKVLN